MYKPPITLGVPPTGSPSGTLLVPWPPPPRTRRPGGDDVGHDSSTHPEASWGSLRAVHDGSWIGSWNG